MDVMVMMMMVVMMLCCRWLLLLPLETTGVPTSAGSTTSYYSTVEK